MFIVLVQVGCLAVSVLSAPEYGFYPQGYYSMYDNDGGLVNKWSSDGRGNSAFQGTHGYRLGQDGGNKVNKDTGFYRDVSTGLKKYGDGEKHLQDSFFDKFGKDGVGYSSQAGHNKGYTTKGFQDYHHKDEVGKKTTFYDSSDNAGDKYDFHRNTGEYGGKGVQGISKNYEDGVFNENTRGHDGHFGAGFKLGHEKVDSDSYDKKGFFDGNGYADNKYWNNNVNSHAIHKPSYYPVSYSGPYAYGGTGYMGGPKEFGVGPVNSGYGLAGGLRGYGIGYGNSYMLAQPYAHHYEDNYYY